MCVNVCVYLHIYYNSHFSGIEVEVNSKEKKKSFRVQSIYLFFLRIKLYYHTSFIKMCC